jgi:5-aminolevulinate synthase
MIDGMRQSSAEKQIWHDNNVADLERLLAAAGDRPKLIAFESLYSMGVVMSPRCSRFATPPSATEP